MFLTKRINGVYYLKDHKSKIFISCRTKNKTEAIQYLRNYKQKKNIKSVSLSQFYKEYFLFIAKTCSYNHGQSVRLSFKFFINHFGGDVMIDRLTYNELDTFLNNQFKRTQHGAWLFLRCLKSAFNKAVSWGYLEENLFRKIKLTKPNRKLPAFINETELDLICSIEHNPTYMTIYKFAFYTGLRLNEITSLRWSDVNLNDDTISLKETKGRQDALLPINNKVKEILKSLTPSNIFHLHNDNFVFTNADGGRLKGDAVSKNFKKCIRRLPALNQEIHFHSLRHSCASALVSKGISIYAVKELLRHKDISTTQIYSHLKLEDLRNAVNVL